MKENNKNDDFSISSLIRSVHNELIKSQEQREAENIAPLFEVESLTIEANFIISKIKESKGKFDLKIIGVDGMQNIKKEQVHKIILKLKTTDLIINKDESNKGGYSRIGHKHTKGILPAPSKI